MSTLLRLLALLGLAVLVVLAPRLLEDTGPRPQQHCAVGRSPDLLAVDPPPLRLAEVSMRPDFTDALVDRHELRPDRRLLFALVLADCLVTGRAPSALRGEVRNGMWSLSYRGRSAGSLPALPDFPDAVRLISEHVGQATVRLDLAAPDSVDAAVLDSVQSAIDGMRPSDVATALQRIDDLWTAGNETPALLEAAAKGLVYLTVLGDDQLEVADAVAGRALATLVIARELAGSELRREEALLALRMGYASHAHAVARTLPPRDGVRLHVLGEDELLREVATTEGADGVTLQLARAGSDVVAAAELAPPEAPPSSDATDASLPPFLPPGFRAALTVAEILVEQHGLDAAGSAAAFEQDVSQHTAELRGPFLDADTYASYLAGAFYSELYREARRRLDRGSASSEDVIARRLRGADVPVADDLGTWYQHLVSGDAMALELDMTGLSAIGARPLRRSLDDLSGTLSAVDQRRQIRAAQTFARRLDSRVGHLHMLGHVAGHRFFSPRTRERALQRVLELAGLGQPRTVAWMAMYEGDGAALEETARDTTASISLRSYALELAAGQELLSDAQIRSIAWDLIEERPLDWDLRSVFLDYLEEEGDYAEGIEVVADWWNLVEQPSGFPRIFARTAIARLYQASGDLESALEWVEPITGSNQNGAMGRAASIHAERGEAREALTLARDAVEGYPRSAWSRSILAEVHWRLGEPEEAARALRDARGILRDFEWRGEVARAFAAAFADRPTASAVDALAAVRGAGIPTTLLLQLAIGLRIEDRPDLAFELMSRFAPAGSMEGLFWWQRAYGYLVEAEGPEPALSWYRETVPSGVDEVTSMFMFSEGHPELLWSVITDPDAADDPQWVWLMRAAAFVRWGGEVAQEGELLAHYGPEDRNPYHRMGRYLMGLDDEDEVLRVVTQADRLTEVAYYVGIKAESEGRIEDAIEWYRVVLDTGLMQEGEYRWALGTLWSWASQPLAVTRLSAANGG